MKNKIFILLGMFLTFPVFSQQSEFREIKRNIQEQRYSEAENRLKKINKDALDEDLLARYVFLNLELATAMYFDSITPSRAVDLAVKSIQNLRKIEKEKKIVRYTTDVNRIQNRWTTSLVNEGILNMKKDNFKSAQRKFANAYQINPSDTIYLYMSAGCAMKSKQDSIAIRQYKKLIELDYTGGDTLYIAKNNQTNMIESFGTHKKARDLALKSEKFSNGEEIVEPSKKAKIYKNLAFILVNDNNFSDGEQYLIKAYELNPKDFDVLTMIFRLYMETNRLYRYQKYEQKALKDFPDNPRLYFNMAVVYYNLGYPSMADIHLKKAYELAPENFYVNRTLGSLILENDASITSEINLKKSRKDTKKRLELIEQKKELYNEALKYFRVALQQRPEDEGVKSIIKDLTEFIENN